jgi:hypothetical protein
MRGRIRKGKRKVREGIIRNRKGRKEMERKRRKGIGRGEERGEWKGRIGKGNERGGSRQISLIRCPYAEVDDSGKGTYHIFLMKGMPLLFS